MVRLLGSGSEMPITGPPRRRLIVIAEAQRGRVSRRQLHAAGVPPSTVTSWCASGLLRRVHTSVFAVGPDIQVPLQAETAALLAVRDGAALSHHTAARLWGMRGPNAGDGRVHVLVAGASLRRRDGFAIHRTGLLERRDIRILQALPVTSPARTLLDLSPVIGGRELERALDQALVQRRCDLRAVAELLARCGRHRGRGRLQALLDAHATTTFTRSEAEERFLALVREAGLEQPLCNVWRHGFEIDFLWPDRSLAVEIDGFAYHGTRAAFERDRRRDARLRAAGITVIRVTWRRLIQEPIAVMVEIAQALALARGPDAAAALPGRLPPVAGR